MYLVYGIPNCDTVKKATTWLLQHGINFRFHDYKKDGITKEKLEAWCRQTGWQQLLNKKGTTWRALNAEQQAAVVDEASAIALMLEKTSVIKRPVVESGSHVTAVGFDETLYQTIFQQKK